MMYTITLPAQGRMTSHSSPPSATYRAQYLGLVFSTTECGVAARSDAGCDAYAAVPMEARATLHGWPAHYLEHVPRMLGDALCQLQAQGWTFERPGYLSQSWRQHDLAVLDDDGNPLIPAPSWECHAAVKETSLLNKQVPSLIRSVGRIEPRFGVAKLPWILRMDPALKRRVRKVMFSGDWVAGILTGQWRMSTSDALCNGLLDQKSRCLAEAELNEANRVLDGRLNPDWFPDVISSREVVGTIRLCSDPGWDMISRLLQGWRVVASLGDNQATAAGSGTVDHDTIVLSMGTSGTINRPCPSDAQLRGHASRFEYWDDRLLLLMLASCGSWYGTFRKAFEPDTPLAELNELSRKARIETLRRLRPPTPSGQLRNLDRLEDLPRAERVASVQFSIALEMLDRTKSMLREVIRPRLPLRRFVLTGGLVHAPLLREVIRSGLKLLVPDAIVLRNSHRGALAHKSDALGAIYNATMAHCGCSLRSLVDGESRPRRCNPARGGRKAGIAAVVAGELGATASP